MKTILIGLVAGAIFGGLLGNTRSCETGGCPLTATPLRGAIWGGLLGTLFALSFVTNAGPGVSDSVAAEDAPPLESVVTSVTSQEELAQRIAAGTGTSVLLFHAEWCGACTAFKPTFATVAEEMRGKADFYMADTEKARKLAGRYGVQYLPTTLILSGNVVRDQIVGSVGKKNLTDSIAAALAAAKDTERPAPEKSPAEEGETKTGQKTDGTV